MTYKRKRLRLLIIPLGLALLIVLVRNMKPSQPIEAVASLDSEVEEDVRRRAAKLNDGTYRAHGQGFSDEIHVEMRIENSKIEEVYVYDHNENPTTARLALTRIPYEIQESQSVNVDLVSGASMTSQGVIEAAKNCIRQAGGNPSDF